MLEINKNYVEPIMHLPEKKIEEQTILRRKWLQKYSAFLFLFTRNGEGQTSSTIKTALLNNILPFSQKIKYHPTKIII